MYKAWRNFYELFQDVNEFSLLILNLLEKTIPKYCLWERRVISFSVSEGFLSRLLLRGYPKGTKSETGPFFHSELNFSPIQK